ncbi:MAG: hypothetical protein O3C43_08640 [Verrucomicrobia bacterium]|nr:hypothetical protein [Verrucomicrobiota bacterium]MDA1066554.1 hypothetical protein [Verrucomicrobiota bacterium]
MTAEENNPKHFNKDRKSNPNLAMFAILGVGVLYILIRVFLHFKAGE